MIKHKLRILILLIILLFVNSKSSLINAKDHDKTQSHQQNNEEVKLRLFDYVVAKDGSGDGTTIQSAFDAAIEKENSYLIFVKNGIYDFDIDGYASLESAKRNVSLIGQSKTDVVLRGSRKAGSGASPDFRTSLCQTLAIFGDNFYCENITIENRVNANIAPLGVALKVYADKAIFKNVRLLGYQDTHLTSNKGNHRQYYLDCEIHGTVDFIFGNGICYFDKNLLYLEPRPNGSNSGNCITAAATSDENSFGYIFNNCIIDGPDSQNGKYRLGRPWKNSPRVVYLNTIMKIEPASIGWGDMPKNAPTPKLMAEYNSRNKHNDTVDLSGRKISYLRSDCEDWRVAKNILCCQDAADYNIENVLAGKDGWNPRIKTTSVSAPKNVSYDGNIVSWDRVDDAICYWIFIDNVAMFQTCDLTYTISVSSENIKVASVSRYGALSPHSSVLKN